MGFSAKGGVGQNVRRRFFRAARIAIASAILAGALASTTERTSTAHDITTAATANRELSNSDDFRVRVAAALYLGKSKSPNALKPLEAALSDPSAAVRTAAAVALRTLGNPAAIGSLARQLKRESAPATRSQIVASLEALRAKNVSGEAVVTAPGNSPANSVKYAVKMGSMKNLTNVRGDALGQVMQRAAHMHAASIPGAVVVDDEVAAAKAHAPLLVLDGVVLKMAHESKSDGKVNFSAQVEFSVSKMPEHMLKVALRGGAISVGSERSLANSVWTNALEDQAVEGAVQSALSGCNVGLDQAVK